MRHWQDEGPGQAIERLQGKKLTKSQEPCKMKSFNKLALFAGVAELADAQNLGSCGRKAVQVQLLSPPPMFRPRKSKPETPNRDLSPALPFPTTPCQNF